MRNQKRLIPVTQNGYTHFYTFKEVQEMIRSAAEYCKKETKTLSHAIYASKKYDEDGQIEHVWLYGCYEVDDAEFDRIAGLKNYMVYAMHKGTAY